MNLKDLIKETVTFLHYQKNELWYKTESGYVFSVPISDTGDSRFLAEDRGIFFMRWIKNSLRDQE